MYNRGDISSQKNKNTNYFYFQCKQKTICMLWFFFLKNWSWLCLNEKPNKFCTFVPTLWVPQYLYHPRLNNKTIKPKNIMLQNITVECISENLIKNNFVSSSQLAQQLTQFEITWKVIVVYIRKFRSPYCQSETTVFPKFNKYKYKVV